MRNRVRRPAERAGFTLMELLLVMAILVILLSFVAPQFMGSQKRANIGAATSQVKMFKPALENFYLDMNRYPTTDEGLQALLEAPDGDSSTRWQGPYIDGRLPLDPWDNEYQYRYPPERNEFDFPDIWSMGPDPDAEDDDIGNWPADDTEN